MTGLVRKGTRRLGPARAWRPLGGQRGQGLVEYSLILVLVAVVAVVALSTLGGTIKGVFEHVNACLSGGCSPPAR